MSDQKKSSAHQNNHSNGHGGGHHIIPLKVYYNVCIGLLILTAITVGTSYIDFGVMNIVVAMVVATIKALLVILFFMGLKYDGKENQAAGFSAFLFLFIFVGLVGIDVFFRKPVAEVKIDAGDLVEMSSAQIDVKKLMQSDSEKIAKGKALYNQQCATCHGAEGQGNGVAAASLNPKPRNFTAVDGWKNGREFAKVFTTLTKGLNTMPSFGGLSAEDRFSLIHYVRTFMPNAPVSGSEDEKTLSALLGSSKPKLPISMAMEKIIDHASVAQGSSAAFESHAVPPMSGDAIYGRYCQSCHGPQGQGGIIGSTGVNPMSYVSAQPLRRASSAVSNKAEFQRLVSEGIPGRGMPGHAQFSGAQWEALYKHVVSIAK